MVDVLLAALVDLVDDVLDDLTALFLLCIAAGTVYLARLHRRVNRLEREVQALCRTMDIEPTVTAPAQAASPWAADVSTPRDARTPATDRGAARPVPPAAAAPPPAPAATSLPGSSDSATPPTREPFVQEFPRPPGLLSRLMGGGNWLVRGGVLLLFAGVGFLLKFAADNALLPVELRLGGVMAAGGVLLALGLRLAPRRPAYAMALEGGGVWLEAQ